MSIEIPLCDDHAQTWFTMRNHLTGGMGAICAVCAHLPPAGPRLTAQIHVHDDKVSMALEKQTYANGHPKLPHPLLVELARVMSQQTSAKWKVKDVRALIGYVLYTAEAP